MVKILLIIDYPIISVKSNLYSFFAFLLILVDPTLSTQFVIVNPEIIQLFLFFLAINSILHNRIQLKTISLFFLSIISLRSMLLCGGVFLFEILNRYYFNKRKESVLSKKLIFSYIIIGIPAITYLLVHYISKDFVRLIKQRNISSSALLIHLYVNL